MSEKTLHESVADDLNAFFIKCAVTMALVAPNPKLGDAGRERAAKALKEQVEALALSTAESIISEVHDVIKEFEEEESTSNKEL